MNCHLNGILPCWNCEIVTIEVGTNASWFDGHIPVCCARKNGRRVGEKEIYRGRHPLCVCITNFSISRVTKTPWLQLTYHPIEMCWLTKQEYLCTDEDQIIPDLLSTTTTFPKAFTRFIQAQSLVRLCRKLIAFALTHCPASEPAFITSHSLTFRRKLCKNRNKLPTFELKHVSLNWVVCDNHTNRLN